MAAGTEFCQEERAGIVGKMKNPTFLHSFNKLYTKCIVANRPDAFTEFMENNKEFKNKKTNYRL